LILDIPTGVTAQNNNMALISCEELHSKIEGKEQNLLILDCTYKPGTNDGIKAYQKDHIPTAVFCDFEAIGCQTEYIRRALHSTEKFTEFARGLGVNDSSRIVCYDRTGPFCGMLFSARVWWLFKLYGHKNVSLLNGGFVEWKKQGLGVESGEKKEIGKGDFVSTSIDKSMLAEFEDIIHYFSDEDHTGKPVLYDAREHNFFMGKDKGPLPDKVNPGRVPGFINCPTSLLFENGKLKDSQQILEIAESKGYHPDKSVITTCEFAIKGATLHFALLHAGIHARLFNGALTEVGHRCPEIFVRSD
jgi:thiosulfate/3-mercaptopyruvate sulfurtransferase